MTPETLRDRVSSVVATLGFTQAQTPFSFDLQPAGQIDRVFRVALASGSVLGGFNYSEERTDVAEIWVARTHNGQPSETYRTLVADVSSVRTAVIRDGLQASGDYLVPDDGFEWDLQREPGSAYAVLRLRLPLNYETTV